jgi:hypothetical protein
MVSLGPWAVLSLDSPLFLEQTVGRFTGEKESYTTGPLLCGVRYARVRLRETRATAVASNRKVVQRDTHHRIDVHLKIMPLSKRL